MKFITMKFRTGIGPFQLLILSSLFSSCVDFVDVETPNTQLVTESVFTNDATATTAVLGMYEQMTENVTSIFNSQLTIYSGLSSDELVNTTANQSQDQFFANNVSSDNGEIKRDFWNTPYRHIYQANSILEGLRNSSGITEPVKNQLEGEAKFIRAFCHFYLVNLFGDIPYVSTTDYRINSKMSRTPEDHVYEGIIADLLSAQTLLSESYVSQGRVRPNKLAATALLARVFLYRKDWSNAEVQATSVIENSQYGLLTDLNGVFLAGSLETIWQLIPVIPGLNTNEGFRFQKGNNSPPAYAALSPNMLNSFEPGDRRATSWVTSYVFSGQTYSLPYKYKVGTSTSVTEYYVVLRLAEQYLIRAEARAQQDKLSGAISDIDVVRKRSGLPLIGEMNPGISKAELLMAIEQERKVELFAEWGHRWMDLKRTDRAGTVLSSIKGMNWQPTDALYPIPQSEILVNANLEPQNSGY